MNQVTIKATVTRVAGGRISIEFGREGKGDDLVDMWADRILAAASYAVQSTIAAGQAAKAGDQRPEVRDQKAEGGE